MEQVKENIASAEVSRINSLTEKELALFDQVREKYGELCPIPCTKCGYCMPCPNAINILRNLEIYNQGVMYDKPDHARRAYTGLSEDERASACIQCGECKPKCPQHIPIIDQLEKVARELG